MQIQKTLEFISCESNEFTDKTTGKVVQYKTGIFITDNDEVLEISVRFGLDTDQLQRGTNISGIIDVLPFNAKLQNGKELKAYKIKLVEIVG